MSDMNQVLPTLHRRLNITLPQGTLRLLDRVAPKGDRSQLIARAVESYVERTGHTNLQKLLKKGYQHASRQGRMIAAEWFPLEEEVWKSHGK